MREPMKTGARDNSAAVRVGSAFFFTGGFIGAARVDRWTTGAIVSFERGTRGQRKCGDAGRAGRAGTTRSAERAGGRGNARRRSSRRGGVVRGRAGAAPVETRASSVRLPPAQKVPRRANVSRAFGKNDARRAFEARNGTGRPRRRDRARAGSGRTIAGRTSDTRVRARFSVEARLSRAPRAVSVDPAVKRSLTDAAPVPFPEESARPARSDDAPRARLASPFAIRHPGGTAPRLPPRHAHPRSPSLPSERRDAVRCAGTARARTGSVKAVGRSPRAFDRRSRSRSAVDRDRIGRKYLLARKNPNNLRFSCAGRLDPRLGAEWIKSCSLSRSTDSLFSTTLVRGLASARQTLDARRLSRRRPSRERPFRSPLVGPRRSRPWRRRR